MNISEKTEIVLISELVENSEQTIENAIIDVKDGLSSKTIGPVLVKKGNGKLILGDGYHRIAQAIVDGKTKVLAVIVQT